MSYSQIANQFVQHFYTTLNTNRAALADLYGADSFLTYNGQECPGIEAIGSKIMTMPFQSLNLIQPEVASQPGPGNSVLVQVSSMASIDGDAQMPISHTFFLMTNPAGSYYVKNEIFKIG